MSLNLFSDRFLCMELMKFYCKAHVWTFSVWARFIQNWNHYWNPET